MAGHEDISRVPRLEVVELGARRRRSDEEKIQIVEESYAGSRLISATARRQPTGSGADRGAEPAALERVQPR
jgi:hypothetical protein